jgi:hypothetical protein
MSIIRKFFTFIISLNIVGLVLAILGTWQYPRKYTGALVLGNLLAAILARNEFFGRLLYLIANTLFAKVCIDVFGHCSDVSHVLESQWPPLWFRLGCTSALQHLGGVHSGCATSAFAWLVFRLVLIFNDRKDNPGPVRFAGVVTAIFVAVGIASALPWVRNTHHKYVVSWLGSDDLKQNVPIVCLSDTTGSPGGLGSCSVSGSYYICRMLNNKYIATAWIFVILGDTYDPTTHTWNHVFAVMVHRQDLWFCLGMTVL